MMLETGSLSSGEIQEQLHRMLASKRFRLAEKQSEFLAFVVKRALKSKKSPGPDIAVALFPDSIDKTPQGKLKVVGHDVRSAARNLRRTLKRYYAEEGREDPVIISLPEPPEDPTVKLAEGDAYTPRFARSPIHALPRELRLGNHFHRRGLVEDEEIALQHFAKALAMCPGHIEAAIGVIETWCGLLDWGQQLDEEVRFVLLPKATQVVDAEWVRGSKYWRLYAAAGNLYFHAGGSRLDKAGEYFAKAKTLDRARTESYQPYIVFLVNSRDMNEALRLSKRYLDAHEDDSRAYTTYVMALVASKRNEEVEAVLERALIIDRSDTFVRYLMVQLRIWQHRQNEALPHIELMKLLMDHRSFGKTAKELRKRFAALPDRLRSDLLLSEPAPE